MYCTRCGRYFGWLCCLDCIGAKGTRTQNTIGEKVMWYKYCTKHNMSFSWLQCILCLWENISAKQEALKKEGKKESDNKLSYELDWNFIEAMAKRMEQNKGKYPPYNRKKPMDIESLKQALLRHTIEVMKGNYTDIEDYDHNWLWHIMWIACNAMFIYYQLKNHDLRKQ